MSYSESPVPESNLLGPKLTDEDDGFATVFDRPIL